MKNVKNYLILFLAVILYGNFLSSNSYAEKKSKTMKIGAILPLTGSLSMIGESEKNAAILAMEEINALDGISGKKLQMVIEDSQGISKTAIAAAQRLIEIEKVKLLIVSTSPAIMSVKPYISEKDVLMFGITAQPDITDNKRVFRISPHSAEEMENISSFCKAAGIKRIVFLYPNNEFGLLSKKYFTQYYSDFGKIELIEEYSVGQKDFRSIIFKVKNLNPDWVVFEGYPGEIPTFIKQVRELGLKSRFITSIATTWSSTIDALVKLRESPVFLAPEFMLPELRGPKGSKFNNDYKEKYGFEPNWDAAFTYDNIMLIKDVIEKSGPFQISRFRNELKKLKEYNGVSGTIHFDSKGDVKTSLRLATIKDGKIVPYFNTDTKLIKD